MSNRVKFFHVVFLCLIISLKRCLTLYRSYTAIADAETLNIFINNYPYQYKRAIEEPVKNNLCPSDIGADTDSCLSFADHSFVQF